MPIRVLAAEHTEMNLALRLPDWVESAVLNGVSGRIGCNGALCSVQAGSTDESQAASLQSAQDNISEKGMPALWKQLVEIAKAAGVSAAEIRDGYLYQIGDDSRLYRR